MPRSSHSKSSRQKLVSFSGIDGAGKSTQIAALCEHLQQEGVPFRLIAFWDEIATLKPIREGLSHTLFGGDKGVGTPDRPVNRRDKNIQSWYMTVFRLCLYFLDTLSLRAAVAAARRSNAEIVIFDRYLYDQLANLPIGSWLARAYARLLLRLAPQPDVIYLLDADPVEARRRKPEYPIDFLQNNRTSYLAVGEIAHMTVIPPLPTSEVSEKVITEFSKVVPLQLAS